MCYTGLSDNDQNGQTGGLLLYTANILRVLIAFDVTTIACRFSPSLRHADTVQEWASLMNEQTRSGNQLLADKIITVY